MEYRFSEQLERILGSSTPSTGNEITYDIEEINEEESRDGDEDLQFVGQTSRLEIGTAQYSFSVWFWLDVLDPKIKTQFFEFIAATKNV